jgi:drug/metabolite transporter (DMT)-like permease
MTPLLMGLVLTAALLHAVWNAMVKSRATPEFSIAAFQLIGALVCLCLAPLLPAPDRESWSMILASVIIHNVYYFTLARAYRTGDLSQVYPLFRGLAPVLVAAGAALTADEWLTTGTMLGIGLVSLGVTSLAFMHRSMGRIAPGALGWGLCTAVLIAMYTVVDGLGVRAAGNALSYIVWLFIFEVTPIACILLLYRRRAWLEYMRSNMATVVAGGIASSAAYGLVIFAMGLGAMAVVSSLRETSVIFAAIIGAIFLHEPFGRARIRAAVLVAIGIGIMRLLG